jgi:hypothetical protein
MLVCMMAGNFEKMDDKESLNVERPMSFKLVNSCPKNQMTVAQTIYSISLRM